MSKERQKYLGKIKKRTFKNKLKWMSLYCRPKDKVVKYSYEYAIHELIEAIDIYLVRCKKDGELDIIVEPIIPIGVESKNNFYWDKDGKN